MVQQINLGKRRAVFITNIPAPYRVAMLNLAGRLLSSQNVELKVLFSAAGYRRRHYWKGSIAKATFSYKILSDPTFHIGPESFVSVGLSVPGALHEEKPDVVVAGGFSFPSLFAAWYTSRKSIPLLIFSGETLYQESQRPLKWSRKMIRKLLLNRSVGGIAYGSAAKELLMSYNLDEANVFIAINSIDTDEFISMLDSAHDDTTRSVPLMPRMLFVGDLRPGKGVEFALRALKIVQQEYHLEIAFDIVGGGEDLKRMKQLAGDLRLREIRFHGSMSNEELLPFYLRSSFFVFPSVYDIYGLVMVEAAAAGLPIIASRFAGGTVDIVENGRNGFVIDPTDIHELAERIRELCKDPEKRKAMGEYSRSVIADKVNIQKNAEGFVDGIMSVLNRYGHAG